MPELHSSHTCSLQFGLHSTAKHSRAEHSKAKHSTVYNICKCIRGKFVWEFVLSHRNHRSCPYACIMPQFYFVCVLLLYTFKSIYTFGNRPKGAPWWFCHRCYRRHRRRRRHCHCELTKLNCSCQSKGQIVIWYDIIRFLRSHPYIHIHEYIRGKCWFSDSCLIYDCFLAAAAVVVVIVFDQKKFPLMIYWPLRRTAHSFIAYAWDFFCIWLSFFLVFLFYFSASTRHFQISLFSLFTRKLPKIGLYYFPLHVLPLANVMGLCMRMLYGGQNLSILIACKSLCGFVWFL